MALKLYFWQYSLKEKKEKGFTLLELLIVVIIVGILAAVAIPNLLAQVGKSRESEAKNFIATVNRAQQSYFMEKSAFAETFDALEISVSNQNYYNYAIGSGSVTGMVTAVGKNNPKNGTHNFIGGVQYVKSTRVFNDIICRSLTGGYVISNQGIVDDPIANPLQCPSATMEVIK